MNWIVFKNRTPDIKEMISMTIIKDAYGKEIEPVAFPGYYFGNDKFAVDGPYEAREKANISEIMPRDAISAWMPMPIPYDVVK